MRGSLDDPPIIIRQTRFQHILLLALFAFVAALAISSLSRPGNHIWTYVALLAIACGFMLFGRVVASPGTLTLNPDGLIFWTGWTMWSYAWSDIDRFEMVSISTRYWLPKQPGFIYSDTSTKDAAGRAAAAALGGPGGSGALGDNWEISAQEMIDLLNSAHARWKSRS